MNFTVFTISLFAAFLNYAILKKLDKITLGLKGSILFFINALVVVIITQWFYNLSAPEDTSNLGLDKLIALNSLAMKIRNSVIFISLLYLSYGTYNEYMHSKNKAAFVTSIILMLLTILCCISIIVAGAFII